MPSPKLPNCENVSMKGATHVVVLIQKVEIEYTDGLTIVYNPAMYPKRGIQNARDLARLLNDTCLDEDIAFVFDTSTLQSI